MLTILQIVGWLMPLDLLHLARASKTLRGTFMSKSNRHLWRAARRNVPGLPECPEYLPEPRYAAFLFDQYCFVSSHSLSPVVLIIILLQACGIERSTKIDSTLMLRFCAPCYKAKCVGGFYIRLVSANRSC